MVYKKELLQRIRFLEHALYDLIHTAQVEGKRMVTVDLLLHIAETYNALCTDLTIVKSLKAATPTTYGNPTDTL